MFHYLLATAIIWNWGEQIYVRFQIFTMATPKLSNVSEEPTFLLRRRRKLRTYETSLHFYKTVWSQTSGDIFLQIILFL